MTFTFVPSVNTEIVANRFRPAASISVLLAVLTLSACSGDGTSVAPVDDAAATAGDDGSTVGQPTDGVGGDGGNTTDGATGDGSGPLLDPNGPVTQIIADTSLSALPAGTRSRAYTGTVGDNTGVFFLDDINRLIGLMGNAQGEAHSIRVNLDASTQRATQVREFAHRRESTRTGFQLLPFNEFGSGRSEEEALRTSDATLEVIDGQRITSIGGELNINLNPASSAELLPVSATSLQGTWVGGYTLCDALNENCSQFTLQFSVDGNELSGRSATVAADGTDLLPTQVSGSLSQRGDVMAVSMRWNTYAYDGFLYVDVENTTQLMLVATTDSEIADHRMLVSSLVRLQ